MDPKFLKEVQAAGWQIAYVDEDFCVASCSSDGCKMRAKLVQGRKVPELPSCGGKSEGKVVEGFNDARQFLRERRESLALSIEETEETAGICATYMAKFERLDFDKGVNANKLPNVATFIEWAQTLGLEVVLRPTALPSVTLRAIADTRRHLPRRSKRYKLKTSRAG